MIYVLFGPPGVGKTYIGEIVYKNLGIPFFDGDLLLDENDRISIRGGHFSQQKRDTFISFLEKKVDEMSKKHLDIVVSESFIKELNRVHFLKNFPQTKFIYVKCPYGVAKDRVVSRMNRENHVIDEKSFENCWNEFDIPELPHELINNSETSDYQLIESFKKLMK